jgi:hypothetical protein
MSMNGPFALKLVELKVSSLLKIFKPWIDTEDC